MRVGSGREPASCRPGGFSNGPVRRAEPVILNMPEGKTGCGVTMAEYEQITEKGKSYVWVTDDSGYDARLTPIDYDALLKGTPLAGNYVKKKIQDADESRRRAMHWKLYAATKLWDGAGGKYSHAQLQKLIMRAKADQDAGYDRLRAMKK